MELTLAQRRTLVALACRVAWADGTVTEEERGYVLELARRFAPEMARADVERWLDEDIARAELASLPESLERLFFYEALKLMEADGELSDAEQEMLERIMNEAFRQHGDNIPVARIALRKRG